jgi:hypothetical protein
MTTATDSPVEKAHLEHRLSSAGRFFHSEILREDSAFVQESALAVQDWSVEKVQEWVRTLRFPSESEDAPDSSSSIYAEQFGKHFITGDSLLDISEDDMKEMDIKYVGDRIFLRHHIRVSDLYACTHNFTYTVMVRADFGSKSDKGVGGLGARRLTTRNGPLSDLV